MDLIVFVRYTLAFFTFTATTQQDELDRALGVLLFLSCLYGRRLFFSFAVQDGGLGILFLLARRDDGVCYAMRWDSMAVLISDQ